MKLKYILVIAAIGCLSASPVFQENGLAIKGYDTVAYFTMNEGIICKKEFSVQHD